MQSHRILLSRWIRTALPVLLAVSVWTNCEHRQIILVDDGVEPPPILVAEEASAINLDAAKSLAAAIEKITGSRPEVIQWATDPAPERAIWVGLQPGVADAFPGLDTEFSHPEEILIVCKGNHVLIAGRDVIRGETQIEFGTANAVFTFLQNHLGVRWLWPGQLGEDFPQQELIRIPEFTYRFHPPFRERVMRYPTRSASRQLNRWWQVHQRGRGSLESDHGHAFDPWWELYHRDHPEFFALQPDGSRGGGHRAKQCLSNPDVVEQWLENTSATIEANPARQAFGASPTDGGGWCVCPECRAWDYPDADPGNLTDRHVKFWNRLANGLRERHPERNLIVDVMAYSRYRTPPLSEKLAENVAVAYVAHFPAAGESERELEKAQLLEWAKMASMIKYRPNLFWYSGGVWGFPSIATRNTIEDFRWLAQNGCVGIDVDSVFNNFATLGPQLYLMAQLTYDPFADGKSLMADYYQRGFGVAAAEIESYFKMMEDAHTRIVESKGFAHSSGARYRILETLKQIYSPAFWDQAGAILSRAEERVAAGPETQRQRVAFIRTGWEFCRLQSEILVAMDPVRESQGSDREALRKAFDLCAERDRLLSDAPPFAFDAARLESQITRRGLEDYLGPPRPEWMEAAAAPSSPAADATEDGQKTPTLAATDSWKLVFEDDFQRDELGDSWEILKGQWAISEGRLVSKSPGATISPARDFSGLQKVVFEVAATSPDTFDFLQEGGEPAVSDLSPFIHAAAHAPTRSGYFLQFGGGNNQSNALHRKGSAMVRNASHRIEPDKIHTITAEFDGKRVQLSVDEQVVLDFEETTPLLGEDHGRVGIYIWTGAEIHRVQVYTAEPRQAHPDLDDPDFY